MQPAQRTPERAFKGIWIPKEIWLCETLSLTERCLLADIHSFDEGNGCYASNEFLGKKFQVTKERMANLISKLRKDGWLRDISQDTNSRMLKVKLPKSITENVIPNHEKRDDPITESVSPHIKENTVEISKTSGADAPMVSGRRKRASQESIQSAQERKEFERLWKTEFAKKFKCDYAGIEKEFIHSRWLIGQGRGPQGLMAIVRDAWANPQFGWNCENLKTVKDFAQQFNKINAQLTERKDASQRSNKPRTDGNQGTANEGIAHLFADVGKVV